jgi:hypothetical protein
VLYYLIIWDEYKHGEEIYNTNELKTKKYEIRELACLIKYMLHEGFKPKHIKEKLSGLIDGFEYLTEDQQKFLIDMLFRKAKKYTFIYDRKITVYKTEINKIHKLNNLDLEKLLFVMLVYNKWAACYKWFYTHDSDFIKEAKLTNLNSQKKQDSFYKLCKSGLLDSKALKFKKNSRNIKRMWHIKFLKHEGRIAFEIDNYINVVYRYLNYIGEGSYFECKECGGMFIKNSNRQELCSECRKVVNKNQTRLRVQKYRNKENAVTV